MNDGRRTRLPPFEPSRCDESNSGGSVLLSPLDAEIIGKKSMNQLFIDVLPIISVTNDGRKTKLPSFDSSYRDGSDGSSFVLLPPLDAEIIGKTSMNQLFIDVLLIISVTNDGRKTKPPPFDSSHRDGSNGGSFVLLPLFV